MSNDELDRLLRESLKSAGDQYDKVSSPQRKAAARHEFLERYEKRRWVFPFMSGAVAVGAAVLVGLAVFMITDAAEDVPIQREKVEVGADDPFATFPVDGEPVDIGVRDTGLWVADAADGEVVRFDPETGDPMATIEVGDPRALSIGVGSVWIGDPSAGLLYEVEKASNAVVGDPIEVGEPSSSMSISVGDAAVWVVIGGDLKMVDLETHEVSTVPGVPAPQDVAANVGLVWVLDAQDGLLRLDQITGERAGEPIEVQGIAGDVYAGTTAVWIADRADDTIVSVDSETGVLRSFPRVRGTYVDMGFDDDAAWVLSRADGTNGWLTPLDLETGDQLQDPIKIEGDPVDVATGAGSVWIALRGEDAVARIDALSAIEGATTSPEN